MRPVLEALVEQGSSAAARSVADRLALRRELLADSIRESVRREWPRENGCELFVLRDSTASLNSLAGIDLLELCTSSLPPERVLAVSSRTALPPALHQTVQRCGALFLGPQDLALSAQTVADVVGSAGLSSDVAHELSQAAQGWPLATRILVKLQRDHRDAGIIPAASGVPAEAVLSFAIHRAIATANSIVRDAIIVAGLRRGALQSDLVRVLGPECDDLVVAQLVDHPFVESSEERIFVHPEAMRILNTRFTSVVRGLYERTINALTGDGDYVGAARVALDHRDVMRAAIIINAAPPYTAEPVPLLEYERIIDKIDRSLVPQFPNIWIATTPYRTFAVDRATFVREAETVYYCLPPAASGDQRAAALMLLANAYTNVGRIAESDQLIDEGLAGFAREPSTPRASILNLAASLRGIEGRFSLARELAHEAATITRDSFGENQTLHYIDAHEATYRGRVDRLHVVFDELLRRRKLEALPLYIAHCATNAAFFSWAMSRDDRFRHYLEILQDVLTPGIEHGFLPMINAAFGRPVQLENAYPWPVVASIAHLYQIAESPSAEGALAAARAAVRTADERRDPFVQILAHVAVYVLDADAREAEGRQIHGLVGAVESPELREAVSHLLVGRPAGILEPFIRSRVLRERARTPPRLVFELLTGSVISGSGVVPLTDKEMEILALLASSYGPVSRDRIGEALWDHLDPAEWPNNVKVTLSRLRRKVGDVDVVTHADGRYRLAASVEVDLPTAEALVRTCVNGIPDEASRHALMRIFDAYRTGAIARFHRYAWMGPFLRRIEDLVCTAGTQLALDAIDRNELDCAFEHARAVAEIDPYHELACEAMIRVLLARGDVYGARREFQHYARQLHADLGAAPSKRLTEVVHDFV